MPSLITLIRETPALTPSDRATALHGCSNQPQVQAIKDLALQQWEASSATAHEEPTSTPTHSRDYYAGATAAMEEFLLALEAALHGH
jgi:hypothetical protein